jgi:hypothetical protein
MSRRTLLIIAAIIIVVAFGIVLSLKRALKASTTGADLDSGGRRPAPTSPR